MKKKSIMGLDYKWEVLIVYLLPLLGLIFSLMKDKKIDNSVKEQYNQSGVIFIISLAISILLRNFIIRAGILPIAWMIDILSLVIFVFEVVAVVKAFSNESYKIPVIYDLSQKLFK